MNTVFLERICRCCLNESEDMTSICERVVGIESFTFDQHFTFSDLIYLCTNVQCDLDVVDDTHDQIVELPRNVCETCLHELRSTFLFRQKCESSDNVIRQQIHGLDNRITEEIVEFNATIDGKYQRSLEIDALESTSKEELCNNECVLITEEKPILIAVDEHATPDETSSIEFQIVSVVPEKSPKSLLLPDQQNTKKLYTDSHPCKLCDNQFETELDLQAHNRQHHLETEYRCSECSKEFHTEKGYLAHKKLHSDGTSKKKFLCSTCGKFFATKQRLETHAVTHTGEKRHGCNECDKKFSSESRLRCHRRTHTGEKPYRCDQCDLTFAQGNALRCHMRIHTGEKPYECRFCSKRFTQNTILKTHMTLHTGKTIKCPDCDKMFSRASNLILHRREHTGEKPYVCGQCPNRYKQKSHLDRHMDTHLGVKHTCEICQKSYSKRWSLKVHMFSHSKEKPHKCTICDTEFTRRDKYKLHMKTVHGLLDIPNNSI